MQIDLVIFPLRFIIFFLEKKRIIIRKSFSAYATVHTTSTFLLNVEVIPIKLSNNCITLQKKCMRKNDYA